MDLLEEAVVEEEIIEEQVVEEEDDGSEANVEDLFFWDPVMNSSMMNFELTYFFR